ncbi:type III secretion system export apparatus subunit SctT [Vibrio chagasii]|uniref:EscT/YscT/HrcT family type III secretion system export apparatus protein n=1 Tax=Vibrio chagasii TaxID=170679 RepID=A0A7Y3YTC7_9VIBR|nr:type III secretion system export apparatus subunit SctT [Vibrio chagasii]NOH35998.1 EscT/YscT/HrcT family type III secretion system export apparatus protein [Vibrio chagasii]
MPFSFMEMFLWLKAISIAMARLLPIVVLVPFFSSREVKGMLRYSVTFALALFVAPNLVEHALITDITAEHMAFLILKEVGIGVVVGALLAMPFWLFDSVGALFDNQRGALIGGQFNPLLAGASSPIGHILQQCVVITLITVVGVEVLLNAMWTTYEIWSPYSMMPEFPEDIAQRWLLNISKVFLAIVVYTSPLVVLMLFIEFAMALLGLYSPQMQVFVLSIPVKCLVGLASLTIYLIVLFQFMEKEIVYFGDIIRVFL